MKSLKCDGCGADLEVKKGAKSATCSHCGKVNTFETDENSVETFGETEREEVTFGSVHGDSALLPERENKKTFKIFESALACVLFILFHFIFVEAYSFIPAKIRSNFFVSIVAQFLVEFVFAFAAWVVAKSRKIDIATNSGINKKINGKLIGLAFLISLVSLVFLSNLTSVFSDFLGLCGYKTTSGEISIPNFWVYLCYILVLCIAPAIFEELLFRGVILSGFREYGAKIAIVISALIFMLMHGGPDQTIHQFIIGLITGYIFYKTGNLWVGIVVHFFNNFIAVTELFIFTVIRDKYASKAEEIAAKLPDTESKMNPWVSLFISLIFALIFAWLGYFLLKRLFKKVEKECDKLEGKNTENEELLKMGEKTTISVDGKDVETTVTIDAGADEETKIKESFGLSDKPKKPPVSTACIVMFALSGLYLVVEWVLAFLTGFGI